MSSELSASLFKVVVTGAVMGLSLIPALAIAARPERPFEAAAVFPPWWDAARVEAAVGSVGEISARGRTATIVVVTGGADVAGGLRAAGAWLILSPGLVDCARRTGAAA